jgi:transcriptional regulator with XRE-family HTH domain
MRIAERIRKKRKEKGFKQSDLAIAIGLSLKTISRWEKGERVPDANDLNKLASILGTSVAYLVGERDDPSPPLIGSTKPHTTDEEHDFIAEQRQRTYPRPTTLEDIVRARESSRNLQLLEESDLRAAAEMAQATLRAIEREYAVRTAQQDGEIAKSA